jgi:hypothetical protein
MRVFADTTCDAIDARDPNPIKNDVGVRRTLYRANLSVEIAVDQHVDVQARVAAANLGRVG